MKNEKLLELAQNIDISSETAENIASEYIQYLYFQTCVKTAALVLFVLCIVVLIARASRDYR